MTGAVRPPAAPDAAGARPHGASRRPGGRSSPRGLLGAVVTILGVAGILRAAYDPWYLNYDARYALLWARDFWSGSRPEYLADFAPTPHPLQMAASSLALPFGEHAEQVIVWTVLLCFGAVVWLIFRLGSELFHPAVGAVAALVVFTRPAFQRDALLSYQDVPFAALIVGAALLEARSPRRGAPVLVLLALAGLLRPEAWVLAGLYVLWLWPARGLRGSVVPALLAALAPVVWATTDWLVTGDLLHSLHGTAELAEEVGRRRHIEQVPFWTAQYFGFTLREPLVLGVPIGLVFAWHHARRRAWLPLAIVLAMTAVFAVGPLFGLPLIGRYVRTPAAFLALFYGLAVCGWLLLPPGRSRRRWQLAGLVALAASIVFIPWHAAMLSGLERRIGLDGALYRQLEAVGDAPEVRAAFARCAPLSTADHRPIPFIRYWLDGAPGSVGTIKSGASPMGRLFLVPRRSRLAKRTFRENFPVFTVPQGYRTLYENPSWRVWAAPGCLTRPRG
ncbi:MAG: hypothetical protein AVDCRST_MAG38-863 [uncultured Solirubrobacteraceae bacterium]|uniref:Glycosyltransferase RgtA/B/C/D-like domain-containing protein n=1 Tax=uncultured Solirubrobacteraceae bacterium TaxID=1162706 RepID=A0A6J4R945_9ACTN|nr:MAG: hypothetical protein AVDCRST_MAG38-863 [uncultured Solirubrobacteraceae bacterium]